MRRKQSAPSKTERHAATPDAVREQTDGRQPSAQQSCGSTTQPSTDRVHTSPREILPQRGTFGMQRRDGSASTIVRRNKGDRWA